MAEQGYFLTKDDRDYVEQTLVEARAAIRRLDNFTAKAKGFTNSPTGISLNANAETDGQPPFWLGIISGFSIEGHAIIRRAYTDTTSGARYFGGQQTMEVVALQIEWLTKKLNGTENSPPQVDDVVLVFRCMRNDGEQVFYYSTAQRGGTFAVKIVSHQSIGSGVWLYQVRHCRFALNGTEVGITESAAEDTVACVNVAEFGAGDGVPNPPPVGTLTKLPHPVGSYRLAKEESPGLYAFCMANPYEATCE